MTSAQTSGEHFYFIFLHVALAGLIVVVWILSAQNRDLKNTGTQEREMEMIAVGDRLDPGGLISVIDSSPIPEATGRRLVLVFSTTCAFCTENLPHWRTLVKMEDRASSVLAISLDPADRTVKYVQDKGLTYPVFVPTYPTEFREKNRLGGVPKTLVVSGDWMVEAVWTGLLSEENIVEVSRMLP